MDDTRRQGGSAYSRGRFLGTGVAGVAVLGGSLWATAPAAARARRVGKRRTPIRHLIISCQENRSFDHYFGYAPQVKRAPIPPASRLYAARRQPPATHAPYELAAPASTDPPHSWAAVHAQYDAGKMDGFYITAQNQVGDGNAAIPYYTATELPFYYSLFRNSALCANYFCSVLGPTWPNRFYLMSGTSGGITTNGCGATGSSTPAGPIILDLLEDAGVSWKIYNIALGQRPERGHR